MKTRIHSLQAPGAVGPYSQAIRYSAGGATFVHTAGQVAIDPATGTLVPGGIAEQTKQVLANLEAILETAGLTLDDVVKTTVFLASMSDFKAMNEVYATRFTEPYPARSTVAVKELPLGALVEIDVVGVRG
jgi:2-iminobutanoate/2-iminopropanoate deaminase